MTVDEYPVAEDVHHVAADKNPHGYFRIGNSVRKLPESIEPADKRQGDKLDEEVRAYERKQLLRLSQPVDVQVEGGHDD